MVWVFSCFAVCVALVLVLAGSPDTGVQMFQMASDAANEHTGMQAALSFFAAIGVGLWFGRQFGQWAEAGEHSDAARADAAPDTIDELRHLLETRAFTTSLRFWLWSVLYGLALAIGFLMVVFLPDVTSELLQALQLILGPNPLFDMQIAGGGLLVGVAMSVLFAGSVWEGKLRRFFQRRALIPEEARRIYEELTHTVFDYPPPEKELAAFLREQKEDHRTPTYFDFEFHVNRVQQADKRMELLPRIAFMRWRIRRLLPKHAGFAAIRQNKVKFEEMEGDVDRFEQNAMTCSGRLLSVLHGLVELETAMADAGLSPAGEANDGGEIRTVKDRIAESADISGEVLDEGALPVSRLDNVSDALVMELESLEERISRFNQSYSVMDEAALKRLQRAMAETVGVQENAASYRHRHVASGELDLHDAYGHLNERLETLKKQIGAVQASLVPVSIDHLKALDEKMETENPDLVTLSRSFIGLIVCAGLSAYTTPNRDFFRAFGLNPTLGYVRFRFERALMLIAGPLVLYCLYLIWMAIQTPEETFKFTIWFLFGTLFIAGSIIYGCVHGASLASVTIEKRRGFFSNDGETIRPQTGEFTALHGLSAFVFSASILIIGVYLLCLCFALDLTPGTTSSDAHRMFRGAWPFSAVAAVWSVLCARVTFYASIGQEGTMGWKPSAAFLLLSILSIGLVFGFMHSSGLGKTTPWEMIIVLAVALTGAVLAGARWSIDVQRPPDAVVVRGV